ncbi:MAG TPA: hypothetical protein VMS76_18605 [Planctomycetota bacterium]|nr:hypothetical protein [Planctomycetota bacterium]
MPSADPSLPVWVVTSLPWLAGALVLAAAAGAVGTWLLLARVRELERLGGKLDALERLESALAKLAAERGDLDLRRIEHALLEIRDLQRRLEDALLRTVQVARAPGGAAASAGEGTAGLSERIVTRLVALGYERVQLVTPLAEMDELCASESTSGDVLVEARRNGVLCKGRVRVRGGVLAEVEMQPAYAVFP